MKVAVVGGGITGLAAAVRLRDRLGEAAQITVYEQSGAPGGKLRTGSTGGLLAERGADAFLVRPGSGRLTAGSASLRPLAADVRVAGVESAAVGLARRVGLELVHPEPVPAGLWRDGGLRPFPPGTLMGIPGDLPEPDNGQPLLGPAEDVAVGELVRRRLGDQVVDEFVDPMLGGVYAGRADALSLAATMPGLAAACRTETTLTGAVRSALAASPRPAGAPVFASVHGGLSRLVEAVAAASGANLVCGRPVRELTATERGWRLLLGSTRDSEPVDADGVVLAVPARPASRLLAHVDTTAAGGVGELDYASVALVTFGLPLPVPLPQWSGFLVPAGEGTLVKAVTFVNRKWAHRFAEDDLVLVRASVGRYGDPSPLRLADPALAQQVHKELSGMLGGLPEPVAVHVQRWGGALPQYRPGHLARVAAARSRLPATLRLAGAGYDGVGIAACVDSGQVAADQLADVVTAGSTG